MLRKSVPYINKLKQKMMNFQEKDKSTCKQKSSSKKLKLHLMVIMNARALDNCDPKK